MGINKLRPALWINDWWVYAKIKKSMSRVICRISPLTKNQLISGKTESLTCTAPNTHRLGVLRECGASVAGAQGDINRICTQTLTGIAILKCVARTLHLGYYQVRIVRNGVSMPLSDRDFLSSYPYHILVDGKLGAGFAECTDLAAGRSQKAGRITLGRGAIANTEFFDWVMQHSAARALLVVLFDASCETVASWDLSGARVVKVTATTFTGKGFPFRVEELELSVESVTAGGKL